MIIRKNVSKVGAFALFSDVFIMVLLSFSMLICCDYLVCPNWGEAWRICGLIASENSSRK
jgi:hypothetical protein